MDPITPNQLLDCKGLNCPLPIIRTATLIRRMQPGQVLQMDATDPASVPDMAAWSRRTRHPILGQTETGGVYSFFVRKAEPA
jgi:tRNA 2-thiouridine synthesizing protein A